MTITHTHRKIMIAMSICVVLIAALIVVAPSASAARSCGYFDFKRVSNINSDLKLKMYDTLGSCVVSTWRAGAGTTQDPCQRNYGWLPTGWYDMWGHWNDYAGTAIRGRVWYVQDKACSDGTVRTELFLHSEETSSRTQECTSSSDDPWCWDKTKACSSCAEGTNDYYSNGCIKIRRKSPEGSWAGDLDAVHDSWHNLVSSTHGSFSRGDSLYVHN